jgi:hypothetical protein
MSPHGLPGALPGYNFAPQSSNQHITATGTHQRLTASTMVVEHAPSAFALQKPWTDTTGQAYTSAADQHQPAPANVWYPQAPHFTHTGGRPDGNSYGHPQQYPSNPG